MVAPAILASSGGRTAARILPNDPRLISSNHYTETATADYVTFSRPALVGDPYNFAAASPGATKEFISPATVIQISLEFTGLLTGFGGVNSVVSILVDGVEARTLQVDPSAPFPQPRAIFLTFSVRQNRVISIVWPTADTMRLTGIYVANDNDVSAGPAPPVFAIYVAGDSHAQGLGCTRAIKAWWYLLAKAIGYQVVVCAFGGRRADRTDAEVLVGRTNVAMVILGVQGNDFFDQRPVFSPTAEIKAFLARARALHAHAHIRHYSCLPVPPEDGAIYATPPTPPIPLEDYRDASAAAVAELADPEIVEIYGPSLITDPVGTLNGDHPPHYTDYGQVQMASNLRAYT